MSSDQPERKISCENMDQMIENLQDDLEQSIMIPTSIRLKILILSTRDVCIYCYVVTTKKKQTITIKICLYI